MCPVKLEEKLESSAKKDTLPKVIIPVHYAGQSCDMKIISNLCRRFGIKIIEDASHAIGATYLDSKVGSCLYSDIAVFSFHPVKIITTGEGGMVLTNSGKLAQRASRLRSHGTSTDKKFFDSRPSREIWNYQQIELGFNYRMTDIQAALGISQLKQIDQIIKLRRNIARIYNEKLKNLNITLPFQASYGQSSFHLYPILINNDARNGQKKIYSYLRECNIGVNIHYIPVHRQPFYENMGFQRGDFPIAEDYFKKTISLPIFPSISKNEIEFVISKLNKILS